MALVDTRSVIAGVGPPRWVIASLDVKEGRDPLGLQTTTIDRLMPRLLPGILELSRRARYFSFYAYLLDLYREQRRPANGAALSDFIKAREWEYGLAVLNCPRRCDSSPVGAQRLRAIIGHQEPPYPRGESVESPFGGFGLYYRSPLSEMGIVARSGTLLGGSPITIDVLYDAERASRLAATFGEAVQSTAYAKTWMMRSDALPLDVLVEYADVACLCQLNRHNDERDAVYDAMFGSDPDSSPRQPDVTGFEPPETEVSFTNDDYSMPRPAAVIQRRRSVAHYLTLIDAIPEVVDDDGAYREALWSPSAPRSLEHAIVAGQWAGLIAKDIWQECLCSIWSEFCRSGLDATRTRRGEGLTWEETQELARAMLSGPPSLQAGDATTELVAGIADGTVYLDHAVAEALSAAPLETLRATTVKLDTATSGLIVLLELHRRVGGRTDSGWANATSLRSTWQPSLASVLAGITTHLDANPTVADTLWWIVHTFVLSVHERIAYSKLPDHTFRFRWEDGRVQFYDNGVGRFPLAAIRKEPLALLTWDLGFWDRESGEAQLTGKGAAFIDEVLS